MDVLDNIKQAVNLLKEVEEYSNELNGEYGLISTCDKKIDYWLHYLELQDLKVTEAYNIIKEIKHQRIHRRKYKNDAELIKLFKDNEGKLAHAAHRDILVTQLHKTDNKQKNLKYNYNAYTEEEVNNILRPKKMSLFDKFKNLGNKEDGNSERQGEGN